MGDLDDERILTKREVPERLRTTERTIQAWLRVGKLKGVRPGGTKLGWRIPESEGRRILSGAAREQGA